MDPGGRGLPGVAAGQTWQTDYRVGDPASGADFRWTASASGPTEIAVPADRVVVFLIRYSGVVARAPGGRVPGGYRGPAEACVWHAPELGRVVRFEFEAGWRLGREVFELQRRLDQLASDIARLRRIAADDKVKPEERQRAARSAAQLDEEAIRVRGSQRQAELGALSLPR